MVFSSCANIIPPGGGPRDSLPPRLVSALPKDSALHFSGRSIVLTFDEFVTLQNVQENLIVSPTVKNVPAVDGKLRNVTIKFRDSLEANTTYTLNFGNAIKDVNEGNILKDFHYVFSTGNTIDHFSYRGKVLLAETGKTDSTLVVVLHRNLADTAVVKERPRYYTRISSKGEFVFSNLPGGNFAVYVLPNDYTKKYDDSTKMFAFRNAPVTISNNTSPDTLYAYEEVKRKEKINTNIAKPLAGAGKEDKRLKFTNTLETGHQDLLDDLQLLFNHKLASFDTNKIRLCDTNYHVLPGYTLLLDTSKTKLRIGYNWKEDEPLRLVIAKDAVADSAGITLPKADTLHFYTKKESEYGSLRLNFTNLDLSRNPVLQFIQNGSIVESFVLTGPVLNKKLYKPGNYELRVLFDRNKNGIWDPGKFFGAKQQPEIVQLIPNQLNIRANWDNEVTIPL
ncbi:MAG: hypothetical protein NVSMB63_00170 [Sediminibacterium sp.]